MAAKWVFVLAVSCTLFSSVCLAQLGNVNIGQVVENLASRFQEIRNEGLGVERLEQAYRDAEFMFETLTPAQIETMLSDSALSGTIESIRSFFDGFDTIAQTASPVSPEDCCTATGSNACCFECGNLVAVQSSPVDRITGALSAYSLPAGGRLMFGFNDGPVIMTPPTSANCAETVLDARLQRWYRQAIQRPLEVVILLDASNPNDAILRPENVQALRDISVHILRSLTKQDRAAIMRADRNNPLPLVVSRQSSNVEDLKTITVCDEVIFEFEQFTTSVSDLEGAVNTTAAFRQSVDLFSSDPNTDKVLVILQPGFGNSIVDAVVHLEQLITARGNDILVSSYRALDDGTSSTRNIYRDLVDIGVGGGVNAYLPFMGRLPTLEPLAGLFASPFLAEPVTVVNLTLGEDFALNRRVLTLSKALTNETDLIGVIYIELPWEQLLSVILPNLANRESSYVFVAHPENHNVLFHPLIPGGLLEVVPVSEVEADIEIVQLLNNVTSGSTMSMTAIKTILAPTASTNEIGFVLRSVPSTYYCTLVSVLHVCVLLTDEDRTLATVDETSVNLANIYSANPSRLPLYHNLTLSSPENATKCDYFCKSTRTDRISIQLTSPSQPPIADDRNLFVQVREYIKATGTRPNWVNEGVATEIGLGSAVAASWIDNSTTASDYITRRHLATPSGIYFTYPPTQFVSDYHPNNTNWYTASQVHPSLITLTPPQATLREGSRLTVSLGYVLKSPTSESDSTFTNGGQTLSVVAADLTVDTLQAFIRQALPLCHQSNTVSCLILDDLGNIVYDDVMVNSIRYNGGAAFITDIFNGEFFDSRRAMVASLLMGDSGLLTKRECEDHFLVGVGTIRFYSMNVFSNTSVRGTGGSGCTEYLVQQIPGTNAFLAVIQETRQCSNQLCFCVENAFFPLCTTCDMFPRTGCECPCICREGRHVPLACPLRQFGDVNQDTVATTSSPTLDTCFNQACNCRTTQESCLGVRECNWCSAQQRCVYNTECCDPSSENCCDTEPEVSRFAFLTCNLRPVCDAGPELTAECPTVTTTVTVTTVTVPPSPESNSAIIIGGVVGGIFAALLLSFIIILFVWYQFCRREDLKDEHSRESAFDFSNKRTEATNPSNVDIQSDDGVKSAKSTSPGTSSHAQLLDGGKADSSTEKTESTIF